MFDLIITATKPISYATKRPQCKTSSRVTNTYKRDNTCLVFKEHSFTYFNKNTKSYQYLRNIEGIRTINIFKHTKFLYIVFILINFFRHYVVIYPLIFVYLNKTLKKFNDKLTTPNNTIHNSNYL